MNLTYCKNHWVALLLVVGVFFASAFFFQMIAKAAEADQIEAAIKDLSSATGQDITSEEQAKDVCNQEQYIDVCADIGKKHDLYTSEEIKHVDEFLNEVKGQVLADIKACQDETCLIKVANQLAQKVQISNPTLATDLKLTTTIVAEKKAVIDAAKEVGLNFSDCESMNPDTAPVDLLRKCAKLAKDSRVQKYIPEGRRVLAQQFEDSATVKLRESLIAGKYQCGDGTLEGCGNYCLNPGSNVTEIPAVCKQIATEVFGPDGVKELEAAHQQVGQVKDYYSKKFILTLPNGKELVGEGQIRNACDQAFSSRNLEIARACGSFAVKNGFVSQTEVDKGLKLMESFSQKGQNVDFEKCISDPKACRDFIPDEDRGKFDAGNQIFEIMRTEIGFDPSQCERGSVDPAIGSKCFDGSKRALAKIESLGLANQSREARFIIEDIKGHIAEGENMMQRKDEFKQVFSQQGGPGGCKSEAECFTYCSNPTNGPECIAFGSKQGISGFQGDQAVQRFQEYNQNLQRPGLGSDEYKPFIPDDQYHQFPGQGPYPGFQPPGQGGYVPPGQVPGFNQPGPGFNQPGPGGGGFYPGSGSAGPSPECFTAIQSGDFARAKTVCSSSGPSIPFPSAQVCPASLYVECPAGQYHESYRNENGCWIDGPCKAQPTYSSGPYPTYSYSQPPAPPGGYQCSDGQDNDRDGKTDYPADSSCYGPDDSDEYYPPYGTYTPTPSCPSGQWWDEAYKTCTSSTPPPYSPGPYPTYSYTPYPSVGGGSGEMYSCFYPNAIKNGKYPGYTVWCEKDYFNCHEGSKSGPSISLDGLALGAASSCEGGYQGQSCNNNKFCDSNETYNSCPSDCGGTTYSPYPTSSPPNGGCPSGYHYHGESGGFCMNDQENYSGTCYNSSGTSKIGCPAQPSYSPSPTYSPYPTYSPGTSYTPFPSCPSGQWWDTSVSACKSTTPSNTVAPSPSYTPYSGYCGDHVCASGETTSSCPSDCGGGTTYSPSPTYSSSPGTSYTPYTTSTYTYTPPPSCPSGQWWDDNIHGCQSSSTTTPYPTSTYAPPPTCSPIQYWNGTSCVNNVTTTYTPPPSTYSPPPAESYSPPPSPPPPTSSTYPQYMIAHCQQLGRTWNGSMCQANGLFARFYENSGVANVLRLFYIVP